MVGIPVYIKYCDFLTYLHIPTLNYGATQSSNCNIFFIYSFVGKETHFRKYESVILM